MASGSLLVIDDQGVAASVAAVLERDGYTVSISTSTADALGKLQASTYDLVLTDLGPDREGMRIISEVCRVQPDTISIAMTGNASLDSALKALRGGAYDYLIKPCDEEELRAVVARGIERRQLGVQLKARLADLEAANTTIQRLNLDLQRRVDQATAELQRRMHDLAWANAEIVALYQGARENVEQLQEVDRLKSRFLSMASHELKTPLTSISGLAQVLLRRMRRRLEQGWPAEPEWQDEQRAHVDRLEVLNSQTARLGRLVDELLDVSRIESGKLGFRWAPVDLVDLVGEVAGRLRGTTSQHTIKLDVGQPPPEPVIADRDHLEQVLDNLVSNAIKFSPAGGEIRVLVRGSGDGVMLSIQDPGIGVPHSQLEAIFDLFYQAEDPISRHTGGMGLGLYISKEIVARHGGRIWAERNTLRGSTFNVTLPRVVQGST